MGKDIARRLLEEGMTVYVLARRLEQMMDLQHLGAIALRADLARDEDIVAAVQVIAQQHGAVNILINNAGLGLYGSVEETTLEDARYQFEVNLFGLGRLTQLLLPGMRAQGSGRIINISSMGGKIYTPLGAWYHASKHALEGWSDCLRIELAAHGIDVVVIEPGIIRTEWGDVMVGPMLQRSGQGPYSRLAQSLAHAMRVTAETPAAASPPSVVTEAVLNAVRSSRPRTRYVAGKMARPLMLIRKYLGDRLFDKAILSQVT